MQGSVSGFIRDLGPTERESGESLREEKSSGAHLTAHFLTWLPLRLAKRRLTRRRTT